MGDLYCKNCGAPIKKDARFCKECGASQVLSLFKRINQKINIFGSFLGLTISFILTFIIVGLMSVMLLTGQTSFDIILISFLCLLMFFGGFFTSIICCDEYDEGLFNAIFLFLVTVVNLAFMGMVTFLVSIGILSALTSTFGPSETSTSGLLQNTDISTSTTSQSINFEPILTLILGIILVFAIGLVGGWLGVAVKKAFR